MEIKLTFRDDEARVIQAYLRKLYSSKAALPKLAKIAVRTEAAIQARIELDNIAAATEGTK